MNFSVILADNVKPQLWRNGGGKTRELLVWPTQSNWQIRISRADINANGPFSAFPGVQRWFTVLDGAGVVLQFPEQTIALTPNAPPLHFDGNFTPGCTLVDGPTQDLNLMTQGGSACMLPVDDEPWHGKYTMTGIYTAVLGVWRCESQAIPLPAHSLLWHNQAPAGPCTFAPTLPIPDARAWWLGFTPEPVL